MRADLRASGIALIAATIVLGLAYPLAMTGVGQVVFPGHAGGSLVKVGGKTVGSSLLGQSFSHKGKAIPRYFQPRPSADDYNPSATFFGNLGPNQRDLRDQIDKYMKAYLALEGPYDPGLTREGIPPDAVQTSASGVDPDISTQNAEIQAHRIAAVRGMPLERVRELISDNTDGRFAGVIGEPVVNVLQLNIALDEESG